MTRIRNRRGTAAAWTAANPVLGAGEPGAETDTGRVKVGDGTKAWSALPYTGSRVSLSGTTITVEGTGINVGAPVGASGWLTAQAALPDAHLFGTLTRDSTTQLVTSASFLWDDASTGTYTATITNGAVSGYAVTYGSGGTAKTVTQPTMTRDTDGNVTARPAMAVTP